LLTAPREKIVLSVTYWRTQLHAALEVRNLRDSRELRSMGLVGEKPLMLSSLHMASCMSKVKK
jgi:hypothetical protein